MKSTINPTVGCYCFSWIENITEPSNYFFISKFSVINTFPNYNNYFKWLCIWARKSNYSSIIFHTRFRNTLIIIKLRKKCTWTNKAQCPYFPQDATNFLASFCEIISLHVFNIFAGHLSNLTNDRLERWDNAIFFLLTSS